MLARISILVVLSLSVVLNLCLMYKHHLQERRLQEQTNKTRMIVAEDGSYSLYSMDKIFQSIKPVDQRTLDCMAVNIYREAATESMAGKIAVGQVVVNRAKNKNYPGDVCSVIYQKSKRNGIMTCQFSWVCIKKLPAIEKTSEAWKKSVKAAYTVLSYDNKIVPDITNGATHYHTHYVSPDWKNSFKLAAVIDQHRFYRIQ